MDCVHVKRLLILFFSFSAIVVAGCADFGKAPSRAPWGKPAVEETSKIPSPAERIERLRALAGNAASANEQQKRQVVAELSTAMDTEEDAIIRAEIVRTLGAFPAQESDALLRQACGDSDVDVRTAACETWGKRGDRESTALLAEVLGGDIDKDVRLAAARSLGHSKDREVAVAALGGMLEDKDPAMQYRAVLSLRKVTGEDFGNDVNRWRQYVQGRTPDPANSPSIAERFRQIPR